MANNWGGVSSSGNVAVLDTLDLVAAVSNLSVCDCSGRYEQALDLGRIAMLFLDSRRKSEIDRGSMRHDTDFGP